MRYITIINRPSPVLKVLNVSEIAFIDRKLPLDVHNYVSVDVIR